MLLRFGSMDGWLGNRMRVIFFRGEHRGLERKMRGKERESDLVVGCPDRTHSSCSCAMLQLFHSATPISFSTPNNARRNNAIHQVVIQYFSIPKPQSITKTKISNRFTPSHQVKV